MSNINATFQTARNVENTMDGVSSTAEMMLFTNDF